MALIAPTVETIGDEALTNSIIDRSITELQDSAIEEIYAYAFVGCQSLKKVVFESVTNVKTYAFENCAALTMADFHQPVTLNNYAFSKCSALAALILRGDTLSVRKTLSALTNTPIESGTGYIYVPAVLVDSYKSSTDWSTYASQIRAIEDYPDVCDPYSWEGVAKSIENGTYQNVYKIGDMIPVDLGSEGVINMQIAAFDADTLADGSGTAAISWVANKKLATNRPFNENNGDANWETSSLRSILGSTIKQMIPEPANSLIQSVTKESYAWISGSRVLQTTSDKVWIPSSSEVTTGLYSQLFVANSDRAISGASWVLRDGAVSSGYTANVLYVSTSGSASTQNRVKTSNANYQTVIGFCTGKTPT